MARTISEIQQQMIDDYTGNASVRRIYNIADGEPFTLSKSSLERIIFYVVACAVHIMEQLFDKHKEEIQEYITENLPHTLRWYQTKVKEYRHGCQFDEETMSYIDEGLTDEQIEEAKVVKYCAVTEDGSQVLIKVADEHREPLLPNQLSGLLSYMARIKDAGVNLVYRNYYADWLKLSLIIWYDPTIMDNTGTDYTENTKTVENCIENYIQNLTFNGEFRLDKLEDQIQKVQGVEIVHITLAQTKTDFYTGAEYADINGWCIPYSGYFKIDDGCLNITYLPYGITEQSEPEL